MSDFAIETVGLTKAYGSTPVLSGLDLQVPRGRVFALLGPNGAGKTTLINILSTLLRPDSGTARVAGFDLLTEADRVRSAISLTGQYATVDEVLTGRENLIMMSRLGGLDRRGSRTRASELLTRFDLAEAGDNRVGSYSGGMRRRLDLAVGLITVPPVIFLDEPTTGLDTRSRQALWSVITGLTSDGVTVFLTTQYLEEADQLAHRIALLHHGRLVADGTAKDLKKLVGSEVVEFRDRADHIVDEVATDGTATDLHRIIADLPADRRGLRVIVRRPSLDDVFLQLTGDAPAGTRTEEGVAA